MKTGRGPSAQAPRPLPQHSRLQPPPPGGAPNDSRLDSTAPLSTAGRAAGVSEPRLGEKRMGFAVTLALTFSAACK